LPQLCFKPPKKIKLAGGIPGLINPFRPRLSPGVNATEGLSWGAFLLPPACGLGIEPHPLPIGFLNVHHEVENSWCEHRRDEKITHTHGTLDGVACRPAKAA